MIRTRERKLMRTVVRNLFFTKLFLFFLFTQSVAQNFERDIYSFEFKGLKLFEALQEIASTSEINLVFDPAVITDIVIYKRIQNQTIDNVLREILRGSSLDFIVLSSGTYVIVRSSRKIDSFGSFSGKIVDKATGSPLPGATIMLADASGGVSSSTNGHFSIGRMLSGTYEIVFSYVGYEPITLMITIPPDEAVRETIQLQPRRVDVAPIVVSAHQPIMTSLTNNELSGESVHYWDGGYNAQSAIRNLSLFTGVQYGIPLSDVHLQGGQSGDHRFFLDGIPVYNPYSFGRLYSSFSPYAIGKVSVDKAGFGAASGSFISGKVNLEHDISNITGESFIIQADPLNSNARFSTGNSESRLRLMGAIRSSNWNWYKDPNLSRTIKSWDLVDPLTYNILLGTDSQPQLLQSATHQTDIRYIDIHGAAQYTIDRFKTISLSVYQGSNEVVTDLLAESIQLPNAERMFSRDGYKWSNTMIQASYNWFATPRLDLSFQAGLSSNRMKHNYAMFNGDQIQQTFQSISLDLIDEFQLLRDNIKSASSQSDHNEINHFKVKGNVSYTLSPALTFQSGFLAEFVDSEFNLEGLFYLPTLNQQKTTIFGAYINTQWNAVPYLRLSAGTRLTLFGNSGLLYPEPRFSLQYDRDNKNIGYWSVKLSGGVYRQFINQFTISNIGPSSLVPDFTIWTHGKDLEIPIAYHKSLTFSAYPSDLTTITLEGYSKIQPTAYITSYQNLILNHDGDRSGLSSFAEKTEMHSYGAGIRMHQFLLQSRVQILAGYDYSVSTIRYDSQFGRALPASWNEPHRIHSRILSRITPDLTIVGKWQSSIGRTWAFRQTYYNFLILHNFTGAGNHSFLNPEKDKLPNFHQFDLSLIYKPSINRVMSEIRLDLINIFNQKNVIDLNLVPLPGRTAGDAEQEYNVKNRTLPGFTPSISIHLGF